MFDFFPDFLYLWWRRAILIVWEGGWAGFPSPTCGPGGRRWGGRRRGGLGLPERLLWIVLEIILKLWTGVFTQRVVFVQILLLSTALWAKGDNQRRHIQVQFNEELDSNTANLKQKSCVWGFMMNIYLWRPRRRVVHWGRGASLLMDKQLLPPLPPPAPPLHSAFQVGMSPWWTANAFTLLLAIVIRWWHDDRLIVSNCIWCELMMLY